MGDAEKQRQMWNQSTCVSVKITHPISLTTGYG